MKFQNMYLNTLEFGNFLIRLCIFVNNSGLTLLKSCITPSSNGRCDNSGKSPFDGAEVTPQAVSEESSFSKDT